MSPSIVSLSIGAMKARIEMGYKKWGLVPFLIGDPSFFIGVASFFIGVFLFFIARFKILIGV